MKKIPLNQDQNSSNKLSDLFKPKQDSNTQLAPKPPTNADNPPPAQRRYLRLTELLSAQQKKEMEDHDKIVEEGFNHYSVY